MRADGTRRPRPDAARRPRSASHPSSKGCAGWPTTSSGPGIRGARRLFSRIDRRRLGPLPQPDPAAERPGRLVPAARRSRASWPSTESILRDFDRYMANGSDHWFHRQHAAALDGPDRLLLRRVRLPRVARHLLGRPRRPRRRPHEDGQRHGPAVRRRRPPVPPGLLPPDDRRRRPPGARLPRLRPDRLPVAAGPGPRRRAAAGHGRRCPDATSTSRSGSPRSAGCRSSCSTRTSPRTARPTGRSPTSCTSAAARCASTRSSSSASAASGPSAPSASSRRSGTSTRATRRSCSPSGPASSWPPGPSLEDALERGPARQRLHDPHAGLGGQRAIRGGPRPADRRAAPRRRRPAVDRRRPVERGPRARSRRRRRPQRVRHDRVLAPPDATARTPSASSTRETANATWKGVIDAADPGHHERHPRPTWVGRRDGATLVPTLPRRRPRRPRRRRPSGAASGSGSTRVPDRRAVGDPPAPEARAGDLRPAAGCATSSPATARRRPCSTSSTTALDPGHPDDRLRPPVRDLQAGRPALQRPRPPGPPPVGRGPAGPGRLRRQGPPGRPAGPAGHPGDLHPVALAASSAAGSSSSRTTTCGSPASSSQGVDVWLNNPRRPLEASGTSGMKAAANGVVNLSVLDGWWDEGWTGDNGWAIGGRETNPDEGAQDWADAQDLYRILEDEVVPRYYERDRAGVPRGLGRADAALDGDRRSGGSRRPGCSTSTSSRCTCRAAGAATAAASTGRAPSAGPIVDRGRLTSRDLGRSGSTRTSARLRRQLDRSGPSTTRRRGRPGRSSSARRPADGSAQLQPDRLRPALTATTPARPSASRRSATPPPAAADRGPSPRRSATVLVAGRHGARTNARSRERRRRPARPGRPAGSPGSGRPPSPSSSP